MTEKDAEWNKYGQISEMCPKCSPMWSGISHVNGFPGRRSSEWKGLKFQCPQCGHIWYRQGLSLFFQKIGCWIIDITDKMNSPYEKKYSRRCSGCRFWSEEEEGREREKCPRCGYDWLGWGTDVKYYTWYLYLISHMFGNCFERKD